VRRAVLALALVLTALSLSQAVHRARQGRCALLKWRPAVEALQAGQPYGVDPETGREGFPTLPMTGLVLAPLLALGDLPGAVAWAVLKLALAWWALWTVLSLAAGRARDFPPWGALLVVLLSARVLASDVAHGNVNLLVAAVLVAGALAWSRGRELQSGLWIGLGAVLKVTPLLFVLYFARKRSSRAVVGTLLGVGLFAFVVPGLALGWQHNLDLAAAWWSQMAHPYLSGAPPGLMQTEHINQSLLGVLARLTTDAVAIPARPPELPVDVRVNLVDLDVLGLRTLHRAACILVVLAAGWCVSPSRARRATAATVGEWSLVALAMLMLSERSWKQHYVTLFLPLAFLAWHALRAGSSPGPRRMAWSGLAVSAVLHGLSGSGVLGSYGSDLAEALGVFLWGAVALFAACGWILRRGSSRSAPPSCGGAPQAHAPPGS
jgi:hypothetical protein